jgi:hypothetical protein
MSSFNIENEENLKKENLQNISTLLQLFSMESSLSACCIFQIFSI